MATCPVCKEEIDSLYAERFVSATITMSYNASYDKQTGSLDLTHIPERQEEPDIRDTLDETYYCPKCNSEVAKSGDKATSLLKGGELCQKKSDQ